MEYRDGEVIGLDNDGSLILFNGDNGQPYNCGEPPEEFGLRNMTEEERKRVAR